MARTSQAEFAAKRAEGQVREWSVVQIGDDLLNDRVPAMVGLGGKRR